MYYRISKGVLVFITEFLPPNLMLAVTNSSRSCLMSLKENDYPSTETLLFQGYINCEVDSGGACSLFSAVVVASCNDTPR